MKPADPPKPPDHPLTDKPHGDPPAPQQLTQQQVDAAKRNEPMSQVDAKRVAWIDPIAVSDRGDRIDPRDSTPAELEAASMRRAAETGPSKAEQLQREVLQRKDPATLTAAEREILSRQPLSNPVLTPADAANVARRAELLKRPAETLTQDERDWLARYSTRYPTTDPDADALAARERVRSAITVADDGARYTLMHQIDGRTTVLARELEGDASILEQLAAQLRLDARDLRVVTPAQTQTIDDTVKRLRAFAAQLVQLCASRDVPLPQIPTLPAVAHVPPARA